MVFTYEQYREECERDRKDLIAYTTGINKFLSDCACSGLHAPVDFDIFNKDRAYMKDLECDDQMMEWICDVYSMSGSGWIVEIVYGSATVDGRQCVLQFSKADDQTLWVSDDSNYFFSVYTYAKYEADSKTAHLDFDRLLAQVDKILFNDADLGFDEKVKMDIAIVLAIVKPVFTHRVASWIVCNAFNKPETGWNVTERSDHEFRPFWCFERANKV